MSVQARIQVALPLHSHSQCTAANSSANNKCRDICNDICSRHCWMLQYVWWIWCSSGASRVIVVSLLCHCCVIVVSLLCHCRVIVYFYYELFNQAFIIDLFSRETFLHGWTPRQWDKNPTHNRTNITVQWWWCADSRYGCIATRICASVIRCGCWIASAVYSWYAPTNTVWTWIYNIYI